MSRPALSTLTMGVLSAAVLAAMPAIGVAAKGKPAPPPPNPPLAVAFATGGYAIEGADIDGYHINPDNGLADGAYINSAGGLEIDLNSGAHSLLFTLPQQSSSAPSYCQPDGTTWTVSNISRFAFNVHNGSGIQSLGNGEVPGVVTSGGATPGYDIDGIINFLPDGADSRVRVLTLRFGLAPGTTLSRTGAATWTLEHDATDPILLQCTAEANRGKSTIYDVGYYPVPFSLTATCNLGPTGTCQ